MTKQAIKEFREIYHREFGIWLSWQEATEKAISLFNLFKTLLKGQNLTKNFN